MDARPPDADPVITAHFLAGGVLGVIGDWLSDEDPRRTVRRTSWSRR